MAEKVTKPFYCKLPILKNSKNHKIGKSLKKNDMKMITFKKLLLIFLDNEDLKLDSVITLRNFSTKSAKNEKKVHNVFSKLLFLSDIFLIIKT